MKNIKVLLVRHCPTGSSACLTGPTHTAKYHRHKATKRNSFLPRDLVGGRTKCHGMLCWAHHSVGIAWKRKERSSMSILECFCLCLSLCLTQIWHKQILVFWCLLSCRKQLFLPHRWEQKAWPHTSHKAFFWAMGFSSDFRLYCLIQPGINFCHFQVKLVVGYMQSLKDFMWVKSWGSKNSLVNFVN